MRKMHFVGVVSMVVLGLTITFAGSGSAQEMPITPHPGPGLYQCYGCFYQIIPLWGRLAQCQQTTTGTLANCGVKEVAPRVWDCVGDPSGGWGPQSTYLALFKGVADQPDGHQAPDQPLPTANVVLPQRSSETTR